MAFVVVSFLSLLFSGCAATPFSKTLLGAWQAEVYDLGQDGQHPIAGQIIFTESEWTVLFFVSADGKVLRASGEGGSYVTESEGRLVFRHLYNLSCGEEMAGLPATPLRMQVHGEDGISEPCRYELNEGMLRLLFPSGNTMHFRRSSR